MTEFGAGKKKNDLGFFNFDLETNLEPLFNWNVKQLFLYLTAEYQTKDNVNKKNFIYFQFIKKYKFLFFQSLLFMALSEAKSGCFVGQNSFERRKIQVEFERSQNKILFLGRWRWFEVFHIEFSTIILFLNS